MLPWLAYWYDGGRPSGCWGFMLSEVVEADAAGAVEVDDGGWWEELLEVRLLVADEVPLEAEAEAAGALGVRVLVEAVLDVCWGAGLSLLGLRVEPTSLRNREFMEDMQRGAFLAGACRGRGEEGEGGESEGGRKGGWAWDWVGRREEAAAAAGNAGEIGDGGGSHVSGQARSGKHGEAQAGRQTGRRVGLRQRRWRW